MLLKNINAENAKDSQSSQSVIEFLELPFIKGGFEKMFDFRPFYSIIIGKSIVDSFNYSK